MKIVPVIDLLHGRCVAAKQGLRAQYQPLESCLDAHADHPVQLAKAYQNRLGLDTVYVADLDAILFNSPNWDSLNLIVQQGLRVWIDASCNAPDRARELHQIGVDSIIIGLESLPGPDRLAEIVRESGVPNDLFILSVDMREGQLLIPDAHTWPVRMTVGQLTEIAVQSGITRFILLDLGRVGTGRGIGTESHIETIRSLHPQAEITIGGGVRDKIMLAELQSHGVSSVLIGTALHTGVIGRRDIESVTN